MKKQEPHFAMEILHSMSKKNTCLAMALFASLIANAVLTIVAFIKK